MGLSNMNRTDAAYEDFPGRIIAAGNEREAVDLTIREYIIRSLSVYSRRTGLA